MIRVVSVQRAILGGLLIALVSNATLFTTHGDMIYFIGIWVSISAMMNIALVPHRFDESEYWYAKSFYAPWFVARDYMAYVKERTVLIEALEKNMTISHDEPIHDDYTKLTIQDLRLLHKAQISVNKA
jgi:hypothetical protein